MTSKKILLMTVEPPKKSFLPVSGSTIPLHLATLIGLLKDEGHEVSFIDNHFKPQDWFNAIEKDIPDYVVLYSDYSSQANAREYIEKINTLRIKEDQQPFKIISIGSNADFIADKMSAFVDYIVDGCYEKSVPEIIKENPEVQLISSEIIENYENLRAPDWDYFIPTGNSYDCNYDLTDPLLGDIFPVFDIQTVKGCQSKLTYCPCCSRKYVEPVLLSAKKIFEHVEYLSKKYNVKGLRFKDYDFAQDKERLKEFCELLKPLEIIWSCSVKPGSVELDDLKLMKSAGCKIIHVQLESGSQKVLETLHVDYTVEQAKNLFKMLKLAGIKSSTIIKVAFPSESEQDRKLTDAFIAELKPDYVTNTIFIGLPGSLLCEEAQKFPHRIDENGLVIPAQWDMLAKKYLKCTSYSGDYKDRPFLSNPLPELIFHKKKNYIEKQVEYIDSLEPKSKIYFYGAGTLAKKFIKKYKMEEANIRGVFDEELSKSGRFRPTKFTIYHSTEIKKLAPNYIFITLDSQEDSQKVKAAILNDITIDKKPEISSIFYEEV